MCVHLDCLTLALFDLAAVVNPTACAAVGTCLSSHTLTFSAKSTDIFICLQVCKNVSMSLHSVSFISHPCPHTHHLISPHQVERGQAASFLSTRRITFRWALSPTFTSLSTSPGTIERSTSIIQPLGQHQCSECDVSG